jgi:hypothetical protein
VKKLISVLILIVPFSVSGEVMQYSLCTLNEGKTIADAQAWLDSWRKLVDAEDVNYEVRLLIPHAGTEGLNQFYIEGASPTLTTSAAAWEWWYSDEDALNSAAALADAAVCGGNSFYISTD